MYVKQQAGFALDPSPCLSPVIFMSLPKKNGEAHEEERKGFRAGVKEEGKENKAVGFFIALANMKIQHSKPKNSAES